MRTLNTDADLSLPVDIAWLSRHAPGGVRTFNGGWVGLRIAPKGGGGKWELVVRRLSKGARPVDLVCHDQHRPVSHGHITVGAVVTRRDLIELYERYSSFPFLQPQGEP